MNTVKKSILSVLLMSLFLQASYSQDKKVLSFEEALQITYQNNHSIKQSEASVEEKHQLSKARKSLYLPTVGLSANYVHLSHDLHLDMNPVKDAIVPLYESQAALYQSVGALYGAQAAYGVYSGVQTGVEAMPFLGQEESTAAVRGQFAGAADQLNGGAQKLAGGAETLKASNWDQMIQKKQFAMLDVNAQWVLYAGGKIRAANKASRLQYEEEKAVGKQKSDEVFSELVQRYYGLALASNATDVRNQVLQTMEKHLSDAQKLEAEGFLAKAEVLHVKMSHAEAKREYMKAIRMEEFISSALRATLADDSFKSIETISKLFVVDTLPTVDYFKQLAHSNSPILEQIESKHEQSVQNYRVKRADLLPSVAVMGMYDLANKDVSEMMPEWMVGAGLSWTLFDGTARFNKIKSAKLKTLQVEEAAASATDKIETAVEKYYNELEINLEQLKELETAEEFANEYVRVRQKAFEEDMANATDLVDARLAQAKVRIERLQAMYQFDLALAKMLQYCGTTELFLQYMN